MNQINCGARLEHYEYLRGSLDRRKEHDWLFDAVVQDAKAVLRQTRHKFALAIEHANVNFDDLGCGLNSSLRSASGFLSVQSEHKAKKKARRRERNCREKIGEREAY